MAPPVRAVEVEVGAPRISATGHVEYAVEATTQEVLPGEILLRPVRWVVHRRFSEFERLHAALLRQFGNAVAHVAFPPKRLFGSGDPAFIVERAAALRLYVQLALAACRGCASFGTPHLESAALRDFLRFDARLSLAAQLPRALVPPPLPDRPAPPQPVRSVWSALGFGPSAPVDEPAPLAGQGPAAPGAGAGFSSSSSSSMAAPQLPMSPSRGASATSASAANSSSSASSPPQGASKAVAMRRLQSRSAIVGSYATTAPLAAAAVVAAPTLAPLPSALPPSSNGASAPAPAPAAPAARPAAAPAPASSPAPAPAPVAPAAPAAAPRPPPPPQAPPPQPPRPPAAMPAAPPGAPDRSGLLHSIAGGGFKLKKAVTVDKSGPRL